mgnify:CR=1 FL=1|jgi:hypothetical protein
MATKKTEIKETVKNVTKAPAKTEVKAPVKAEVKTEIKTETTAPKAEEVKAEVKEEAKKAPAKKATPAKAEIKTALYVQFAGNEVTEADIIDKVKAAYVAEGHKESAIKEINLYVKPEEYAVYYVINDKAIGKVNLF